MYSNQDTLQTTKGNQLSAQAAEAIGQSGPLPAHFLAPMGQKGPGVEMPAQFSDASAAYDLANSTEPKMCIASFW